MFNRNNLPSVPNPFGSRPNPVSRPSQGDAYGSPNQGPPLQGGAGGRFNRPYDDHRGGLPAYGDRGDGGLQRPQVGRGSVGRSSAGSQRTWQLRPAKSPNDIFTFGNL